MQGNENEVEVNIPTNPFGIPGEWRPLVFPEDEAALDEDANTTEPVKESSQLTIASPLPVNKNTSGVFTFGELMASSIERPKAIVEGLIYERQNSLLMGRFGVGKTMFGVQLSLHLATGREFLGLKVPRQCPTLYLDFENDLGDMKNRLSKQRAGMTLTPEEETQLNKHWCYADAGDLESPLHHLKLDATGQVSESLTKLLIQNKAEVLIIDNLGLVATKGDLKEPEDATRFYANLNSIRSKVATLRDGAIIVFHHLTKPSDQGGASPISLLKSPYEYISRARGSGRVLDFARCRLALAEETIGSKVCHVVNGINRSGSISPLILQFNSETLSFERHDDTKFRFDAVFGTRPRGKEIYRQLPEEFTFSFAEELRDPNTGKPLNKGTLSDTLKISIENDFIRRDPTTRMYKKLFDPQSD